MNEVERRLEELGLPELMRFKSGARVTSVRDWELRRKELISELCEKEYGMPLKVPEKIALSNIKKNEKIAAGKASLYSYNINIHTDNGDAVFPVELIVPKKRYIAPAGGGDKYPVFVYLSFGAEKRVDYYPREMIISAGFACAEIDYNSVTLDKIEFESGISAFYSASLEERAAHDAGKLMMWAFAASRTADSINMIANGAILTINEPLDVENMAVIGHSRLGKAALVSGMLDTRFKYVIANDSGCSGDAISRGKRGETPEKIYKVFPHWFCPEYEKCGSDPFAADFDQHFLVASIAPRYLLVNTAAEDIWADPDAQYLSCAVASEVWELYGMNGLIADGKMPKAGSALLDGNIGYTQRSGIHFLGNEDWKQGMSFICKHMK